MSGYRYCSCRYCFNVTVSEKPECCEVCEDPECDNYEPEGQ